MAATSTGCSSAAHAALHESIAAHLRRLDRLDHGAGGHLLDLRRTRRHRHPRLARRDAQPAHHRAQDGARRPAGPRRGDGSPHVGWRDRIARGARLAAGHAWRLGRSSATRARTVADVRGITWPCCGRPSRATDARCAAGCAGPSGPHRRPCRSGQMSGHGRPLGQAGGTARRVRHRRSDRKAVGVERALRPRHVRRTGRRGDADQSASGRSRRTSVLVSPTHLGVR